MPGSIFRALQMVKSVDLHWPSGDIDLRSKSMRFIHSLLVTKRRAVSELDHKPSLQARPLPWVYTDKEGVERELSCIIQNYYLSRAVSSLSRHRWHKGGLSVLRSTCFL